MLSLFGFPGNLVLICKQTTDQCGSIVSSHANEHESNFSRVSLGFESIFLLGDFSVGDVLSILVDFYILVVICRLDNVIGLELWGKGCALDDETHCSFCM